MSELAAQRDDYPLGWEPPFSQRVFIAELPARFPGGLMVPELTTWVMNRKSDKTLTEIEASQTALRDSISATKRLSAQTDRLLKRHRKELEKGE